MNMYKQFKRKYKHYLANKFHWKLINSHLKKQLTLKKNESGSTFVNVKKFALF